MSQEKILSDFSGGINALAAVDKLDPKECLLAENIRLDETGNILSAGAFTHQNVTPLSALGGSNRNNIHSLWWNPSLGGVAGVGQDVFIGLSLGSLSRALSGNNPQNQKMSFASAPNRVYFDVGSVGYWTDMTNLLTVDWSPPSVAGAVVTGPNTGTITNVSAGTYTGTNFGFSLGTAGMQGIIFTVVATETVIPNTNTATVTATGLLLVGGVPVGTSQVETQIWQGTQVNTYAFGGPNVLFGYGALSPSQVNAANFGLVFIKHSAQTVIGAPATVQCTAYQGAAGFVAGTGTTGTLTGTYEWKITFVAANGEESDGSMDSTPLATLSGQQGTLTGIPIGDARTMSRNIYRKGTAVGTPLTLHYLVGSIPDNASTTYSDNLSDIAAITQGTILAGDVPGDYPNSRLGNTHVKYPVYHYDRVFWVNQAQPNQIIWSKPLNGFAYPAVNSIDVGDSKPIVKLTSIFGELIIRKTDSIWRLTGTDETSFDLTQTPSSVGSDQPFSDASLPDKIIFANRYGLWVFNGYTSQPLTTKLDLWFKQDDRTGKSLFGVNGFHPPEVVSGTTFNFDACGNSEKFYFAYAEAGQTQNNALLVFDVKHGNITKREPGIPLPLSLAIDPVTGYVYMGDANGFISLLDDWNGANGGGTALNFDFQHGYQDFQRGSNKVLHALEFYLNTNGQSLTPSVYYDNGLASETLPAITTSGLQRVVRPVASTASKKCQNFSVRLNGTIATVNVSGIPQIQVVSVKPYFDIYQGRARTGQ